MMTLRSLTTPQRATSLHKGLICARARLTGLTTIGVQNGGSAHAARRPA